MITGVKRIVVLFVMIATSILSIFGEQSKTDSLLHQLQNCSIDTTKVILLNELSQFYIYTEIENTKFYADSALNLATSTGFKKGIAAANNLLGIYYLFTSDLPKSIQYFTAALELSNAEKFTKIQGGCYNNLGIIYREIKAYDKALENFYGALKLATDIHDTIFSIKAVLNIATLHRHMENAEQALKHLYETEKICMQQQDTLLMGNYYHEIGAVYNSIGKNVEALKYFKKAYGYFQQMNSWYNISVTSTFLGTLYKDLGNLDLAIDYYNKGYEIYEKLNNKLPMVKNLMEMAEVYRLQKRYKKSKEYAKRAILLANELNNILKLDDAYQTLRKIAEVQNDYKTAYKYSLLEKEISDSIYNSDRNKQIENLEILYETEKKEKEIEILKKDTIILDKESNMRKMQRNVAGAGAVVFMLLLIMAGNRLKLRRRLFEQKEAKLLAESKYKEEEALRREEELQATAEINKLNAEIIQEELDHRNREITSSALYVAQKNEILSTLSTKLDELKGVVKPENKKELTKLKRLIKENIELDDDWENFKLHFEKVHPSFFENLADKFPELTSNEQKTCAYLRMNLSSKEIARLLNITPKSTQMARYRLKKKFNLSAEDDLQTFINHI